MINSSECKVYKVIKDYFKNLKNKKDRKLNVYSLFLIGKYSIITRMGIEPITPP